MHPHPGKKMIKQEIKGEVDLDHERGMDDLFH